jgi:TolA-binding protein
MQSEQSQVAAIYKYLAWVDTHKKQCIQGAVGVVLIGLAVAYFFWSQGQKEEGASQELSKIMSTRTATADDFLKLAARHPNTSAGEHALLLAGQVLFISGKYVEAQAQFQKFRQEYRNSPLVGTASLGVAASLDAQGKTGEAIAVYEDLVQRRADSMVFIQSQFALARLYESQNKLDKALALYDSVAQEDGTGTFGSEAGFRSVELRAKNPALAKPAAAPTDMPATNPKQP